MSEKHKTWTLNNSTRASNPGNLNVNPFRWIRHYPKWPMILFCSLGLFVALAFFVHWGFAIFALMLLVINWLYWQRVFEHFRHGCANPAIIVSIDPMLIAVSTDLTKGIGKYPVIKIIKKSLPTACCLVPKIGSRLPTVALYEASQNEHMPHWTNFDPRPIDCVTGNVDAIQTVMSTFTEDDWIELELWLRQVPHPFRCGLYYIDANE